MNYRVFDNEYNKHVPLNEQHRKGQFPPEKVKPLTIADILPNFDRWSIGYTSTFDGLYQLAKAAKSPSYPPYNIKKFDDGKWRVDMAVAGFRKDELEVTVKDSTLTVKSTYNLTDEDRELKEAEVIHQGIAQRAFTVNFALAEYVVVKEANLQDGILTIKLEQELPEEKKPKYIEIN